MSVHPFQSWQTARVVTAEDTLLTDYKPADVNAALRAKMISVIPGYPVLLRALGKDTDGDSAELVISGWMDTQDKVAGPGPGHRLWRGKLLLGSKTWTGIPLLDKKWGASAAWFEVDTWDDTTDAADYDHVNAIALDANLTDGLANHESCLVLPTLGYTHLLFEIRDIGGAGEMTEIGIMYRLLPITSLVFAQTEIYKSIVIPAS